MTHGKIRDCVFVGGPFDGWSGDFLDTGQKSIPYGEEGFRNDIYDRDERQTRDNKVRWVWNATQSKIMWAEWAKEHNIPPEMLQPKQRITTKPGESDVVESPRVRIEIRHNAESHEWELVLLGKVEAVIHENEIGTPDAIKGKPEILMDWVRSMGIAQ